MKRGFHVLAGMEAVGLKHVFDPAVVSLNHAVGLWMRRRVQTVFDAKVRAEQVELVFACRGAFAQTEEPFAYGSLCEMHGAGDVFPYDKQEAYKWCKLASLEMPFGEARNLAVKILNRYVARMTEDELSVGKASVESWQPLRASKYTMGNVED